MKISWSWIVVVIILIIAGTGLARDESNRIGQFQQSGTSLGSFRLQLMKPFAPAPWSAAFDSVPSSDKSKSNAHASGHKDRKKAFFRSLILPGAGEYYVGKRTFAQTFFAAEVSLWLSHFAFQQYGKWVRKDALAYAATHSGAAIKGKPSQYFVDIGNYSDIYQYNAAKLRFGEYEKVYSEAEYFWSWDEDDHRQKFQNMRIASDRARNRATYMLGAIFANHLISAVHATWQAVNHNKKIDRMTDATFHVGFVTDYSTGQILLQIEKEF